MPSGPEVQSKAISAESVEARYVFVDIVGFSKRTIEAQADVVRTLNHIVQSSLKNTGLDLKCPSSVICIPTGDGLCIAVIARDRSVDDLLDIHVRIACELLSQLTAYNTPQLQDDRRFQIRIGINENTDILIDDINGRKNVAGAGINEAARIMDLGDGNQILVGQNVFNRLEARAKYRGVFKPFRAIVKHNLELPLYQFAPDASATKFELNRQTPGAIARDASHRRYAEILITKGLLFEAIRSVCAEAEDELLIVADHREWIFPLAVTLVMARHRNVHISFVHYPNSDEDKNRGEIRFLRQIGCSVVEHDIPEAAPVQGVFADYTKEARIRAVVASDNPETAGYFGRKPQTKGDTKIFESVVAAIAPPPAPAAETALTINIEQSEMAKEWLAAVPTYSGCTIDWEEVSVRDTRPLSSSVLIYKVEQAKALIRLQKALGAACFQPLAVPLANGKRSPIVPPVLEAHQDMLTVAEGHSRLYSLWSQGRGKAWAFVVRGVEKPLQRPPRFWREVRLDDERAKSAFANDVEAKSNARDIEHYAHQGLFT